VLRGASETSSARRDRGCPRHVQEAALEALCRLEAPEALETLCEAMADDHVNEVTRWTCAEALGTIGNAAALPALEAIANEHSAETLGAYARAAIEAIRR
jgi:HEAT repeat protein